MILLFHKNKDCAYNTSGYQARTINLWEPENDIFFEKSEKVGKNNKYLYNIQPKEESNTFDNQLCNIYNEIGNLTKLKYIRPINYTNKNNIQNDDFEDNNSVINSINNTNSELSNISISDMQKMERDSISVDPKVYNKRLSLNSSQTNNNYSQKDVELMGNLDAITKQYTSIFNEINELSSHFSGGNDDTYKLNNIKKELQDLDNYNASEYGKFISELFDISKDDKVLNLDYEKYKLNPQDADEKLKKVISDFKYDCILSVNKNNSHENIQKIKNS